MTNAHLAVESLPDLPTPAEATQAPKAWTYVPPLTDRGTPMDIGDEPVIAPGVRGYAMQDGERVYVPLIIAEREGSGDVGRFLDSLAPECVIPTVTSPRLAGMLQRRGWRLTSEYAEELGEDVSLYVHPLRAKGA